RLNMLTIDRHKGPVRSLVYSPDGRLLASGHDDGTVALWELPKGELLLSRNLHTDWVRSLAFSPDGTMLLSGGWEGSIRLYSARKKWEGVWKRENLRGVWAVA